MGFMVVALLLLGGARAHAEQADADTITHLKDELGVLVTKCQSPPHLVEEEINRMTFLRDFLREEIGKAARDLVCNEPTFRKCLADARRHMTAERNSGNIVDNMNDPSLTASQRFNACKQFTGAIRAVDRHLVFAAFRESQDEIFGGNNTDNDTVRKTKFLAAKQVRDAALVAAETEYKAAMAACKVKFDQDMATLKAIRKGQETP